MNEHIHCPRHSATLVHQIRSGAELVGFYKCPEPGCTLSAPEVGCLWCGKELEIIDMSYQTATGSRGVLLRCAEHGRWWWQQGNGYFRKLDEGEPGRIALLRSPGPLKVERGDLIVKPMGASGPDGGVTFFHIDEWGTNHRVEGPIEREQDAISRGKALAQRRGVLLWRDASSAHDEWDLQGPPIF